MPIIIVSILIVSMEIVSIIIAIIIVSNVLSLWWLFILEYNIVTPGIPRWEDS
jgi:hypothetical protein